MSTKIEWAHLPGYSGETWNPITGCTKVSAGCKHCYAERMAERFHKGEGNPFDVRLHPDRLEIPLRWRKPRSVFVCSMSDLFHEDVPDEFIDNVWTTFIKSPRHRFMVLTKRPERMREWFGEMDRRCDFPMLANVWLGVSVEDQKTADERIPLLLQAPAAKRFVSYEPALGPVNFEPKAPDAYKILSRYYSETKFDETGSQPEKERMGGYFPKLDWIIAGGESGPGARPANPQWFRSVRDQCKAAGVPYFFKQHGEYLHESQIDDATTDAIDWYESRPSRQGFYRVGKKAAGRLLDGEEWNEYPRD